MQGEEIYLEILSNQRKFLQNLVENSVESLQEANGWKLLLTEAILPYNH